MTRHPNTSSVRSRYATFYLIGRVLMGLWPVVVRGSLPLTPALVVYLTGLITQDNVTVTATAIAAQVGVVTHDDLPRLLRHLGSNLSVRACLAVRLIEALGLAGWLIKDPTKERRASTRRAFRRVAKGNGQCAAGISRALAFGSALWRQERIGAGDDLETAATRSESQLCAV